MDIQLKIYNMLKENTGTHFLDSGGAYGRHFERNQEKSLQDFINENEQTFEVGFDKNGIADEIIRNVSVFHFLAGNGSNLEFDDICKEFNKLNELDENLADCEPYGVNISAWNYLVSNGVEVHRTWNTYNGDSDLSQTLQGANLSIFNDGQMEDYILIQIHGGCDVRGGYTDAVLFKCEQGIINEYLSEYMDNYELIEYELEYITEMKDWLNGELYEGKKLDKIKKQLINNNYE